MPDQKPAEFSKAPDGTINFSLTIPKGDVEGAYKKALTHAATHTEIKGFRKGKAPEKMVETQLGKQKLYSDALQYSLPEAYALKVKEFGLKPITNPRIEPESLEEGQDWKLKVTLAERPQISLGDYKKIVSGAKAEAKIWIPGQEPASDSKTPESPQTKPKSTDETLGKIFDALLEKIKFPLPGFLIEDETGRLLSKLVDQLQRLAVSLDQYLHSLGQTAESLRKQYREQAEKTLRLEFLLNEIALDLKITVEDREIDELIKAVGDEKLRQKLNTPSERLFIKDSLRKRKVTDYLLKL